MHTSPLSTTSRATIASLVRGARKVKRAITKQTVAARAEEKARRAAETERRRERQARERRLDTLITQAIQGLRNMITLAQLDEVKKLVEARESIGKDTKLWRIGDKGTSVSVVLKSQCVTLQIIGERYSPVQNADKTIFPSFETCRMVVDISLSKRGKIERGLFWHLFHADLSRHWDDWDWNLEQYAEIPDRTRSIHAEERDLRLLEDFDLYELAKELDEFIPDDTEINYAWPDWSPNLALMRFCVICSDTATLQKAFESSLSCMK